MALQDGSALDVEYCVGLVYRVWDFCLFLRHFIFVTAMTGILYFCAPEYVKKPMRWPIVISWRVYRELADTVFMMASVTDGERATPVDSMHKQNSKGREKKTVPVSVQQRLRSNH